MAGPPHLAIVVNDPAFLLSHRLGIALAARDRGWRVSVVSPPEPAAAVAAIRAHGLAHHPVRMGRGQMSPRADMGTIRALWRLFLRLRPDLVHLVTIKPVLYGGIAARLARVPGVVAAVSGLGFLFIAGDRRTRAVRALVGRLYRLALGRPGVRVIFQNDDDRAQIARLGVDLDGRAVLIRGSGCDLALYDPAAAQDDPPMVAMPARMLLDKGAAEFVEAARLLRAQGCPARFVYLGAPDPANPACVPPERLAAWRAAGDVAFPGHCADMPAMLGRAALVVLPSYREGMPRALIEAAAAGRAVVTTDVPGCRDAIVPGETGVLVPARDAAALAGAIGALLADPARRAAMGAAGRRLAERAFSVEDVIAQHFEVYEAVLPQAAREAACAASPAS